MKNIKIPDSLKMSLIPLIAFFVGISIAYINCNYFSPLEIQGKIVAMDIKIGTNHVANIKIDTDLDGDVDYSVALSDTTAERIFYYWSKNFNQKIFITASKKSLHSEEYEMDDLITYEMYEYLNKNQNK